MSRIRKTTGGSAAGPPARKSRIAEPWFAEGLRFECQPDCGACCTNHDDYAYVYLEGDDAARISSLLGIKESSFKRRYTTLDDGERVLKMDEPDCPFLDGVRCRIYDARPRQCRTFPFWRESLDSPRSWRRLDRFCPGIDRGETHSLRVIQGHLDDRRIDHEEDETPG